MWPTFHQLSDFSHELDFQRPLEELPRLAPSFFVPPLENKAQNPIMDVLKLEALNTNMPARNYEPLFPKELAVLSLDTSQVMKELEGSPTRAIQELWMQAAKRKLGTKNGLLSWDRLRPSHSNRASTTAFLSEQTDLVYASARHYVQPRLFNPTHSYLYVTQNDLLSSLKTTVLGFSSKFYVWEATSEQFIQIGTEQHLKKGFMLIDGHDEVISESFLSRFLRIGTLLRRLDVLLTSLRTRSAKEGPTVHALAHALSTTISFLREALARCAAKQDQFNHDNLPLLAIWTHFAMYEELLVTLAAMFGRDQTVTPKKYTELESSPVPLLSRIYEHLNLHFERQSPSLTCAIISFILTSTSQEYIHEVALSVGFGGQPTEKLSKPSAKRNEYEFDADDEDEDEEEDIFDLLDKTETSFPTFFPNSVLHALPAAQKSLVLFRIAQPDHPMLISPPKNVFIRWLWTTEEIIAAWNGSALPSAPGTIISSPPSPPCLPNSYVPEIADFIMFDFEPGTSSSDSSLKIKDNSYVTLSTFIDNFPASLPPITPTLAELTSLTFKSLLDHASTLSTSLLDLFINSPGILNFRSHLIVLRSYLLMASPSFKSRLLSALFSDAGEYEIDITAHSMSIRSLRKRPGKKGKEEAKSQPWAMGLSPNLLERETWPPVGADLSFFLRTVIVDSLDKPRETEDGKIEREQVVEEAGWRLGFAIRDLPTGAGRDKWLDPLSIEALDFLYMDYKPPRPLEILISPDILSKYQRMFAFLLRLLRVESALRSLFRMSTHRAVATFLFPTLTQSRKLLLHFRFIAQAFVSSLSGYVFDTAIGGNFDPFLARLSTDATTTPTSETYTGTNNNDGGFSDVFELAQRHSALLDDILSACLLRSGQRGVGDLLRHSLELVLEFTIVVGELHRGRIQEYQAAPLIQELFKKFCLKMTTLTKVLKGLVDKSPSSSKLVLETYAGGRRRPTGGLDALYHLLTRLDLTEWWTKPSKQD